MRKAVQSLLRVQPAAMQSMQQSRNYMVNFPSKNPCKLWEMVVGLIVIPVGAMAPAAWIMSHLDDYRGGPPEQKY